MKSAYQSWVGSRRLRSVLPLGRPAILFAIIAVAVFAACSGGSDEATPTQAPSVTQTDMPTASPSPAPSPTRTPKPRPTQRPFNAIASTLGLGGVSGAVGTRDGSLFCFIQPYQGVSQGDVYLVKGDATGLTAVGLVANSCGFSPDGHLMSTTRFVNVSGVSLECFVSTIQEVVLVETRDVGQCEGGIGWVSDSQHFYMVTVSGKDASGFNISAGRVKNIDGTAYDWPDWQVPVAGTSDGRILASNQGWKFDASGGGSLYYESFFVTDLTGTDRLPLTPDLVVLTQDSEVSLCDSRFKQIDQDQGTKLLPC